MSRLGKALFSFATLSIVALVGIAGWIFWPQTTNTDSLTQAWGNVDTREVNMAFELSGRIVSMGPQEGERIQKGDVLAVLDTEALDIAIAQSQANTNALKAQYELVANGYRKEDIEKAGHDVCALQAQTELARLTAQRQNALKKAGATAVQANDEARLTLSRLEAQLAAAKTGLQELQAGFRPEEIAAALAQWQAAQAATAALERQKRISTLRSPVSGVIRSRLCEPGDMTAAARTVYQIALTDPKWVRVWITEAQLGLVKEGAKALVLTDTLQHPVLASVGYISSVAEFTPKNVQTQALRTALVYEVRLNVPDPNNELRLGQPVTVDFNAENRH